MSEFEVDFELDSELLAEITLGEPSRWKVVFFNDDETPMDFVVFLLVDVFHHTPRDANNVMIVIHEKGSGVAGVYDYEIAEEKALTCIRLARENNFPLQVTVEEE